MLVADTASGCECLACRYRAHYARYRQLVLVADAGCVQTLAREAPLLESVSSFRHYSDSMVQELGVDDPLLKIDFGVYRSVHNGKHTHCCIQEF